MTEVAGSSIGGTYCASCGKRIYTRVDPEKRLNIIGCGCGERAVPIDAPPYFQPQPMTITTNICPSCSAKDAELTALRSRLSLAEAVVEAAMKMRDSYLPYVASVYGQLTITTFDSALVDYRARDAGKEGGWK